MESQVKYNTTIKQYDTHSVYITRIYFIRYNTKNTTLKYNTKIQHDYAKLKYNTAIQHIIQHTYNTKTFIQHIYTAHKYKIKW